MNKNIPLLILLFLILISIARCIYRDHFRSSSDICYYMTKTNLFIVSQRDIKVKQSFNISLHVLKHISQTVLENPIIVDNKQYHFVFMNINYQNVIQLTCTSHFLIFALIHNKFLILTKIKSSHRNLFFHTTLILLKNPFQFNRNYTIYQAGKSMVY